MERLLQIHGPEGRRKTLDTNYGGPHFCTFIFKWCAHTWTKGFDCQNKRASLVCRGREVPEGNKLDISPAERGWTVESRGLDGWNHTTTWSVTVKMLSSVHHRDSRHYYMQKSDEDNALITPSASESDDEDDTTEDESMETSDLD
ncbi:hypothetical protein VIGAN_04103100 [Vigna angularis var. angularis]|uniref:Uncharacterized protein n=1 Tax=Vigna angularis var. angularis TaxID=157739 RepID=A0A0S3RTE5_PHAAN|nr:hypothetical protein VIGAN_04103100 [Vigna angularis var. angularis]